MKIVYPIETKKRELDGVLLLASSLLKSNHEVYIGPKYELNFKVDKIRPDVFIASNASPSKTVFNLLKFLKKNGSKQIMIDTEGGVIIDEIFKKRHHPDLLQFIDKVTAWGKKGAELIHQGTGYPKENIMVTGCPWFDILSDELLCKKLYQKEYNKIVDEYGDDFILYNSRFSGSNTFNKQINEELGKNYADNNYYAFSDLLFRKLNESIKKVATHFQDKKIIIRPHPSEQINFYFDEFKDYKNVFVDERYSVRSWILASKLMFHNGCTTAIESALMNVPTISVIEIENKDYDIPLPNNSSIQVKSNEELISKIREIYSEEKAYKLSGKQLDALNEYIANATMKSIPKISLLINDLKKEDWKGAFYYPYFLKKGKLAILSNHLEKIKLIFPEKYNSLKSYQDYGLHKFPGLDQSEIEEKLKIFDPKLSISITKVKGTDNSYKIVNEKPS